MAQVYCQNGVHHVLLHKALIAVTALSNHDFIVIQDRAGLGDKVLWTTPDESVMSRSACMAALYSPAYLLLLTCFEGMGHDNR